MKVNEIFAHSIVILEEDGGLPAVCILHTAGNRAFEQPGNRTVHTHHQIKCTESLHSQNQLQHQVKLQT